MNTMRVARRPPTPTSKTKDFRGPFDESGEPGAAVSGQFGGFRGRGQNSTKRVKLPSEDSYVLGFSGLDFATSHCLVNSFRFLDFLLWFVLGPGGLRLAPRGPGKAHGWLWGAPRGPPELPGPGSQNLKNLYFCRALLRGRVKAIERQPTPASDRSYQASHRPLYHTMGPGRIALPMFKTKPTHVPCRFV
jgi:hypothetical protein